MFLPTSVTEGGIPLPLPSCCLPLFNVHAIVVSRLDYCWARYEGLPTCRLKCLDRVLRTAARIVGRIPMFGRVSWYMRDVLRWLPYPQRIFYRVSALVRRCKEGLAPPYLRELCCSTVTIQRRISLRSSAQAQLLVPVRGLVSDSAEPSLWLVLRLGMVSRLRCVWHQWHTALFLSSLKTTLFDRGWAGSAPE